MALSNLMKIFVLLFISVLVLITFYAVISQQQFTRRYKFCNPFAHAKPRTTVDIKYDNLSIVNFPSGRECYSNDESPDGCIKQIQKVFILSAIAQPNNDWSGYNHILVNTWDNSTKNDTIYCCLLYRGFHIELTRPIVIGKHGSLHALQHRCNITLQEGKGPIKVTLIDSKMQKCSTSLDFTDVIFPVREPGKFAICTKVAYGFLQPRILVEWFEYQMINGVDLVIVLVNDLNIASREIIEYYRKIGFVEAIPFVLPGTDYKTCRRGFQENRRVFPYFYRDEHVAAYHCSARMVGYDYAALIDFDEFITIHQNITWKSYFNKMLRQSNAAGMTYYVEFFIFDWGKTREDSELITQIYLNRTATRWECMKNVYMPSRIMTSSVTTHGFSPKPGYNKVRVPKDQSTLHHYRKCPTIWKNCLTTPRYTDTFMNIFRNALERRVKNVKNINKHLFMK